MKIFTEKFAYIKNSRIFTPVITTKANKMKKTRLYGSVTYDYSQELPTGFEGYEFIFNGERYFIPLTRLGLQTDKYRVMKHNISTCGIHHSLTDTMLEANTLGEIKRFAKYTL